jgi:hypothetical protein
MQEWRATSLFERDRRMASSGSRSTGGYAQLDGKGASAEFVDSST